MAKRRRLVAPDQNELNKIDEGFAAKPPLSRGVSPPIAQVASEAATLSGMAGVVDRVEAAKDAADAGLWRTAEKAGLVATLIPIDEIDLHYLRRDRMKDDADEFESLVNSIRENGLRTPIEVVPTGKGFGLVAGNRRLKAYQALSFDDASFKQIPAFVRMHEDVADVYLNMVEENEIRSNLTHYERGRIAVLSAQTGVFESVDAAINALFQSASKAKRSKVRSFASIHEALGDLLRFPTEMTERLGLRIAAALRDGGQGALRRVLDDTEAQTADGEQKVLEKALAELETVKDPARGGRPSEITKLPKRSLDDGAALQGQVSATGMKIELKGRAVDAKTAEAILRAVEDILES